MIVSKFQERKLLDLIANLVEKTSADYRENLSVVERLVTLFPLYGIPLAASDEFY